MKEIKSFATETISDLEYKYNQTKIYEENERKRIEHAILMEKQMKEEKIRQIEEDKIRKQLEIQKQEEEKQKKKTQILRLISHYQKVGAELLNDGFPNAAERYYFSRIRELQRTLQTL